MNKRILAVVLACSVGLVLLPRAVRHAQASSQQASQDQDAVPRMVLTFYYPWYGVPDGPGGAGKNVHWRRIDEANKDIQASTHYPALGAYDSHDPEVIDQHCRWAKQAGIDALIVSWWGHGSYSDRAMEKILDGCRRHGLTACIYYETVPRPQTPETAAEDIVRVLNKYGKHSAHLKVAGKPVVFVYGRALKQLGLSAWRKALDQINRRYENGVTAIGDQFSYGAARVFDGVHTYNTAGSLRGMSPDKARGWAEQTYRSWVQLADKAGKISAITVIPGYDDTKIRKPGLAVQRYDGKLYQVQWQQAIEADPHWVLITSFNEWHEGSEIEPSAEYENQYLELTAKFAERFKAKKRARHQAGASSDISNQEKARLRQKLKKLRIGVLPDAESMAFWWLLDVGVATKSLSWQEIAAKDVTPRQYPVLLYGAGERYRSTVRTAGDVDAGLRDYLKAGGRITCLPADPWPFYYDEDQRRVNRSSEFGLTLQRGWENPPGDVKLYFLQPHRHLPHLPKKFAFPESGDLRWRPFFADNHKKHISLLQLTNAEGHYLGDAVAYAEPHAGGAVMYCWFALLQGPYAEALLYDIFDFLATNLAL
jgi:hypothetical protein